MKKVIAVTLSIVFVLILCSCRETSVPNISGEYTNNTESTNTVPDHPNTTNTIPTENTDATNPPTTNTTDNCMHSWGQWEEKTKATCETPGIIERVCNNCHITESEETKITNHKESDWIVEKAAKVGEEGLQYIKCIYCNKRIEEKTIPAITESHQHILSKWVTVREPDCTNKGTQNAVCSCGEIMDTKEILAKGHSMSSKTVAATPTKEAYRIYSCANCTYSYEETIDLAALLKFKSNDDGTCKVTGLKDNTVTELIIPEKSPSGDTVVSIGPEAFKGTSIVSVVIPDTVISVSYGAFQSCKNLKTVVFPQNGKDNFELDYQSFAFCGIEELDLSGTTMEAIGTHAFYGCKNLKTVKLNAVKSIDSFAFSQCVELESVVHGGDLVSIGERSFESCEKLTVLRAENSQHNLDTVLVFYNWAFYKSAIRDIVFNKDLKAINNAFYSCINLGTVDFSQVESAFASFTYSKIEKLIFPRSLTEISSCCFANVTMDSLILPDSIKKIGYGAFKEAKIGKITFGSGLESIGKEAFKDTTATYDFSKVNKPLSIGVEAFANNNFVSFAFPASTVSIGEAALIGCNKLQTLSIPFIAEDKKGTSYSTDCFAWLFGYSIDCWDQDTVVPKSLTTVIIHGENPGARDFFTVNITNLVVGKDITVIGDENFDADSKLQTIYYEGTEQEWSRINLCTSTNKKLLTAEKYFYSETEQTGSGKFWHYDEDGSIVIW